MQYLAIDTGHGFSKGLAETGARILMPSWIVPAGSTTDTGSLLRAAQPVSVTWNDGSLQTYWVGADAARMATSLLARDKGSSHLTRDLTLLVAQRLNSTPDHPVTLAVGLPLAWYQDGRRSLADALTGHGLINGVPLTIAQVRVLPQGVAAVLAALRPESSPGLYGIVDAGYGTTEYLMVDLTASGQPRLAPEPAGTWELGLHSVATALARQVEATWHVVYAPHELDQHEQITVRGASVDLTSLRKPLINQWRQGLIERIQAIWGSVLPRLQGLLVIGGGAGYFAETTIGTMPVTIPDQPQWANVTGYLRAIRLAP